MSGWFEPLPIYVTRKTGNGYIGHYVIPAWLAFVVMVVALTNILAWGAVGLITAAGILF